MNELEEFIEEKDCILILRKEVNMKNPDDYLKEVKSLINGKKIGYLIFGASQNKIIGIKNVKKSYQEITKNIKKDIIAHVEPIIKIAYIENKNIILVKVVPNKIE